MRRLLQFQLRWFFLVATILCVWLGVRAESIRRDLVAIEQIKRWGGRFENDRDDDCDLRTGWSRSAGAIFGFAARPLIIALRLRPNIREINEFASTGIIFVTSGDSISDTRLSAVARLGSLQKLDLAWTRIGDAGIERITGLGQLQELNLSHTGISDAGLKNLRGFKCLEILDLSFTSASDAGISDIAKLGALRRVTLEGTQVTQDGRRMLRILAPTLRIDG